MISNIVQAVKSRWDIIFISICFILVSLISFNLGKIAALEQKDPVIGTGANIYNASKEAGDMTNNKLPEVSATGQERTVRVVGSINSDKYHFQWCSGAKRISPANQIWFESPREAELAGYVLASNCK